MTRFAQIKALTSDRRVSRDPRQHWPALAEISEDWPLSALVLPESAFNSYGPEHRRLRGLISTSFTPRRTEALRPQVQRIVDRLITDLIAVEPGHSVDLRATFAYKVPTEVICDLFGVPSELRPWMRRVIDAALHTAASPEQAQADFLDLRSCMAALIADKRAHPGQDMTSDLIAARDAEGQLDEEQLIGTCILMVGAGSETAVNLILKAVHALLSHPDQLALLRAGTVTWADVIEETLRSEGPIEHMPLRYAVEDIDLSDGVLIKAGDAILLGFGAAGRDPAVHGADADTFDATRSDKKHLAFGHGPHICLGAPLARMEADIALQALFSTFPNLALTDPGQAPRHQESFVANGFQEMSVRLSPEPTAA
ncbi:cytochrome P450 family protein [Streptomyces sp. RKAG337]|uniref:cytochrome P450 family protein n=1 Tax=Streptomyces sp. RKAG337 TaxID=2893404 RepID=UPI0020336071|nr:cytochrome P450 [Streptomyces sp. RKAG337]MCM2431028.1 cytochrome P450 [Streptomyces sp. RKAG337]